MGLDKGIRCGVNRKFVELLQARGEMGNKGFRKAVVEWTVENYGCTWASACTHYNTAFKLVKKAEPQLVEGLGRPDDKKGGRKARDQNIEAASKAVEPTVQKTYEVRQKNNNMIVASTMDLDSAQALVAKAIKQKKATLYIV